METLADYGTVAYFAVDTFTTGIYRAWFSLGDRAAAAQLAAALLAFVVGAVALERWSRGAARTRERQPDAQPEAAGAPACSRDGAAASRRRSASFRSSSASRCRCVLLGRLALSEPGLPGAARFGELAWNSFRVAGMAAVLAVMLRDRGRVCATARAGRAHARGRAACSTLGYAVPGTVLAVGVLLPLGAVDDWLAAFVQREFGVRTGLLLTGTIVALIYAYLVRYFAVAWNGIEPAFARITPAWMPRRAASARARPARCCACMRRCWRAPPPPPRCSCSST